MKIDDDELFAKLSDAFNELYGKSDSEDSSIPDSDSPESLENLYRQLLLGSNTFDVFDEDDDIDNTIILNDENGEEVEFEFLDLIEYDGEEYVVLLPKDDSDDVEEVVILKAGESDNEDEESYTSVDDEETLQAVFNIFKEKFKNEFNFVD